MASYDLKAILGEKLRRLTDKTLKALVDCMCAVGASLCSLDKRVSALESVELPEGGYKPMQEPVASPSASGTAIQFIDSMSQDATGRMTATKKTVRTGSTSQTGVLQLTDSHSSTSTTTAATPKNVKEAYDLANGKADPASVVDSAIYDSSSHTIIFKHGSAQLFTLDAAAFVKDGMVDSVAIVNGNLVITFNTDAGKQPISIPLNDIFNPDNYYTKTAADELLNGKQPSRLVVTRNTANAFTEIIEAYEAQKDIFLNDGSPDGTEEYFHLVPLTEVVKENNNYRAFIFSRPRTWGQAANAGVLDTWTCKSVSPYWEYVEKSVAYAATAETAGTAATANNYTSEGGIANALAGKSNTGHTHDDRYYTKSEIDTTNAQVVNLIDQVDQRNVPREPKAIGGSVLNAGYIGGVVTCVWNNYSVSSPQVSTVVNYCVTAQYQGLNGMTYLLVNNTINEVTLSGMAGRTQSISWRPGEILMVLRWANDYYYIGK